MLEEASSTLMSSPVVMKGQIDWEPMLWEEENWVAAIREDKVSVRIGKKDPDFYHPQWERLTKVSCCNKAASVSVLTESLV